MQTEFKEKPTIMITGASGLIGSRLIHKFAEDYNIVGIDLNPLPEGTRAVGVQCDLTDNESVERSLNSVREKYGSRLASVIHLAAYYDFSGDPSPLYKTLTVEGTRRLLKNLRRFEVEQFVFSSSILVMKRADDDQLLREYSPTEAEWDYPRSKLAAEKVIHEERRETPVVILRIAGVYDEDCHSIPIAQHIRRIYEKTFDSYFFPGDTEHGQAFVHLDDMVECFRKVVERRRELDPEELFLIAGPDLMSYAQLQERLGELIHGKEWPTIRIPKGVAKAGAWAREKVLGEEDSFIKPWMVDLADAHYRVSIDRAQRTLDWIPQHCLDTTLEEIIRRLKEDPKKWYQKNKLPLLDDNTPSSTDSVED